MKRFAILLFLICSISFADNKIPSAYSGFDHLESKLGVGIGATATALLPTVLSAFLFSNARPKVKNIVAGTTFLLSSWLGWVFWSDFTADGLAECAQDRINSVEQDGLFDEIKSINNQEELFKKIELHYITCEYPLVEAFNRLKMLRRWLSCSINWLQRAIGRDGAQKPFLNVCETLMDKVKELKPKIEAIMASLKKHPEWFVQMQGKTMQEAKEAQQQSAAAANQNAFANTVNAFR